VTIYPAAGAEAPVLLLAHGAGAGQQHPWIKRVGRGLASRGVGVATFDFAYMAARKRVPDPPAVLERTFREAYLALITIDRAPSAVFVGGKSMGGRIASQALAAGQLVPVPAGLVCFGYPLHPPGKPGQRRDAHLPSIRIPMLFLQGTRDPFGTPEEMTELAGRLSGATLRLIDGGDHSLAAGKRSDPQGQLLENALDVAAGWMRAQSVPL